MASGFPEALTRTSARTQTAWLDSYLAHLTGRDLAHVADVRDPEKLRRYLRAVAASTAGAPALTTLANAAAIDRSTMQRYDLLFERLFITDRVPAWSSNYLKRVTQQPKRYVCDPALAAASLGIDRRSVLRNADLLGRIIDTFVAAQLRPELALGARPTAMYHLREQSGRREVDLILERRDGAAVAVEVKAAATVDERDARHLAWLRDHLPPDEFRVGLVFYTGTLVRRLGPRLWAVPICALWA